MQRSRIWTVGLLLILVTAAVFGRSAFNRFTWWDDQTNIHQNPVFLPPTASGILQYWNHSQGSLYIPVTYSAWGGLAYLAYEQTPEGTRLNPMVYHAASVAVHAMAALVVFLLLKRLFQNGDLPAVIGALVFAVHPVQVEAVAWASGLKDLLCGLFSLVALWQYLAAGEEDDRGRSPAQFARYALATLALLLALLSKPSAVVVPPIAAALDYFIAGRGFRHILKWLGPWAAIAIFFALLAMYVQPALGLAPAPLWARPLIAGQAVAFYLFKLVLPLDLAPDYGLRPETVLQNNWIYIAWLIPVIWGALLISSKRNTPHLLAAAAVFLIALLPVLGFVKFEFQYYSTVADHYLYLPMLGVAIAIAWIVHSYPNLAVLRVCAVGLVLLAMATYFQQTRWQNERTLWEHNLVVNPQSFTAHNNIAAYFAMTGEADPGPRFEEAVRLNPDFRLAHENLAHYLLRNQRAPEALPHLQEVIRLSQNMDDDYVWGSAHFRLGVGLIAAGRYDDGIAELDRVLQHFPQHSSALEAKRRALEYKKPLAPTTRPN